MLGLIEFDMAARQGVQARRVRQQLRVLRTELPGDKRGKVRQRGAGERNRCARGRQARCSGGC